MAKSILVGYDGSPWAQSAAVMAGWFARRLGAKVALLQAVPFQAGDDARAYVGDFKAALSGVDAMVASLHRRGISAEGLARVGEPVRVLMRAIDEQAPALVCVGTFGRRPVDNWLLGSVADKLARSAPIPVLLMPAKDWLLPGPGKALRALVTVDDYWPAGGVSEALEDLAPSTSVVPTFLELSHRPLAVSPRMSAPLGGPRGPHLFVMEIAADVSAAAREPTASVRDNQAQEVIRFAQDGRYDLIVVPRQGFGSGQQMLLGPVQEAVVRRSPLPVLVLPPAAASAAGDRAQREAVPA